MPSRDLGATARAAKDSPHVGDPLRSMPSADRFALRRPEAIEIEYDAFPVSLSQRWPWRERAANLAAGQGQFGISLSQRRCERRREGPRQRGACRLADLSTAVSSSLHRDARRDWRVRPVIGRSAPDADGPGRSRYPQATRRFGVPGPRRPHASHRADVGGGFGMKNFVYPEWALVLYAARRLGRPVRWISERTEDFVSSTHGRDYTSTARLALDASAVSSHSMCGRSPIWARIFHRTARSARRRRPQAPWAACTTFPRFFSRFEAPSPIRRRWTPIVARESPRPTT